MTQKKPSRYERERQELDERERQLLDLYDDAVSCGDDDLRSIVVDALFKEFGYVEASQ